MKKRFILLNITMGLFLLDCSKDSTSEPIENPMDDPAMLEAYFPPIDSDEWETISLDFLGWDSDAEQPLFNFLEERNTDAFLVLKNGRIVIEKYFGDFTQNDNHVWNSAGKNLTAMTTGIAQSEGFLSLDDVSADYLGAGWSNLTTEQEQNITVWNHLTMTTGLDYTVDDFYCTDPECLTYKNAPGDFWYYHNAPYTLVTDIISNATGMDFKDYFANKIRNKIGMQGLWLKLGFNNNYFSTARSMARYGILNLNEGMWDGEAILTDKNYFAEMTNTSQDLNQAYGYLYWLNGKENYRVPSLEVAFSGKLIPNAPEDLYAGLGANDQKMYVVPSEKLVIIRMGGDSGETFLGPSNFDNELWNLLNAILKR
ncbi:serine hydrolase domain-containing protein [Maribacter sp. 2210JD10-5]|uniref:serine hydrolase domain-containing protein n=1 Tax=Maribacter sp. 2210JD10-5 TaxID=3386272 RepID=UPI0039BD1CBD